PSSLPAAAPAGLAPPPQAPPASAPASSPPHGSAGSAVNPFNGRTDVVPVGRSLFNQHCSHCHSPNAQSPEPSRDLRRLKRRYGDERTSVFYATVTAGWAAT